MARLILVGLPGVGKTTVAHSVAQRWECPVLDTDDVLSEEVGCAAPEFLRREGETRFRDRELEALRTALACDAVVATGGGIVSSEAARTLLGSQVTIWLDCTDDVILARVGDGDRPLLGEDPTTAVVRLRLARQHLYREVSRARVDASGTLEDVVQRVIDAAGRVAS